MNKIWCVNASGGGEEGRREGRGGMSKEEFLVFFFSNIILYGASVTEYCVYRVCVCVEGG